MRSILVERHPILDLARHCPDVDVDAEPRVKGTEPGSPAMRSRCSTKSKVISNDPAPYQMGEVLSPREVTYKVTFHQ